MGGWPTGVYCQPQSLWDFQTYWAWLGLDLGGFGTKGLGPGLDNNTFGICTFGI